MPMPQHCTDCDKVASVLDKDIPYCASCYMKEKSSQKSTYRGGRLLKKKFKE